MKKVQIILIILLLYVSNLNAQNLHDANWIMGYNTVDNTKKEGVWLKFTNKSVGVSYLENEMQTRVANTSISNNKGALIAYTNGCYIANNTNQIMDNGGGLNPSKQSDNYCKYGSPINSSVIFLPHPSDTSLIYLFQLGSGYSNDLIYYQNSLIHSIIDRKINKQGVVTTKNKTIFSDTLTDGMLNAVKHADGKSWWVIIPKKASNAYHSILFSKDGIEQKKIQKIGYSFSFYDYSGQAVFSPDGTKYARADPNNVLEIMDFDRCSGRFLNPKILKLPDTLFCGVAFSPNSRFLYLTSGFTKLYQYDMWANDIEKSAELIDIYNGYKSLNAAIFLECQLAPDGKIYLAPHLTDVIHVINNPNLKGKACNFQQQGLKLPTWTSTIPLFPNYRLGATSAPCITAVKDDLVQEDVTLFPNPVQNNLDIILKEVSSGKVCLINQLGQVLHYQLFTDKNEVNVELNGISQGIYFIRVEINNRIVTTQKIVIQ